MLRFFKKSPPRSSGRAFQRHDAIEGTEVWIGGESFPVRDWSIGGLKISTRARGLIPQQIVHMVMRFKTGDVYMEAHQQGDVVRVEDENAAIRFSDPVSPALVRCFRAVLDFVAQRRAD